MVKEYFDDKQTILGESDFLLCIYIFEEGEAELKYGDYSYKVGPNDIFGIIYLLWNKKQRFSLLANKDCICYRIGISQLIEIFGDDFLRIFEVLFIKSKLQNDKFFSEIALGIDDDVLSSFDVVHYNKGETVIEEKTNVSQCLYIIIDGDIYDVK